MNANVSGQARSRNTQPGSEIDFKRWHGCCLHRPTLSELIVHVVTQHLAYLGKDRIICARVLGRCLWASTLFVVAFFHVKRAVRQDNEQHHAFRT